MRGPSFLAGAQWKPHVWILSTKTKPVPPRQNQPATSKSLVVFIRESSFRELACAPFSRAWATAFPPSQQHGSINAEGVWRTLAEQEIPREGRRQCKIRCKGFKTPPGVGSHSPHFSSQRPHSVRRGTYEEFSGGCWTMIKIGLGFHKKLVSFYYGNELQFLKKH